MQCFVQVLDASPECTFCVDQCLKACECDGFCKKEMVDAAVCVERGASGTLLAQVVRRALVRHWSQSGIATVALMARTPGGLWVNMNQNFDHILSGVLSLLEICTTEGWVDVMSRGSSALKLPRNSKWYKTPSFVPLSRISAPLRSTYCSEEACSTTKVLAVCV